MGALFLLYDGLTNELVPATASLSEPQRLKQDAHRSGLPGDQEADTSNGKDRSRYKAETRSLEVGPETISLIGCGEEAMNWSSSGWVSEGANN